MTRNDTVLDLIAMTQFPSMPAPWISMDNDSSESWVWGDFFILLQIQPVTIEEMMTLAAGKKFGDRNLHYLSAALVFYRKQLNPHGPSSRPVFVASLEQVDCGAAMRMAKQQGIKLPEGLPTSGLGPAMLGSFEADSRKNHGPYMGNTDLKSMRSALFDLIENNVPVAGDPKKIGSLQDAQGHSLTGVKEPDNSLASTSGKGCTASFALLALAVATPLLIFLIAS